MRYDHQILKQARQDRADLDATIAEKKHEATKLLGVPREKRTAAQRERLDTLDADLSALTAQAAEVARELAQHERARADVIAQGSPTADGLAPVSRGPKWAQMFAGAPLTWGPYKDGAEDFLRAVFTNDPRIHAVNTIGDSATGGASVPSILLAQWLDEALSEPDSLRALCDPRPMPSPSVQVPAWADDDHSESLYGGMVASWIPEVGGMSISTPTMRLVGLTARKLGILCKFSDDLLRDGQGFNEQISQKMPAAANWFVDQAILRGSGVGQPLGILNADATITCSKRNGQQAASLLYENVVDMFGRLAPGSHKNAVWLANHTLVPQLLQLYVPTGDGGTHVPVLSRDGNSFTMLGKRVIFTEKCSALGQRGDLILGNFQAYVFGMRQEATMDRSMHPGFTENSTYARLILRADGRPKIDQPQQPAHGDTVSPFVTLESRA